MVAAACHIHSDWSYDGKWSLRDLSATFGRRGYRVLLMTEHDRGFDAQRLDMYRECCMKASSDAVLLVPGIEYSDPRNQLHVLVWGRVQFLGEGVPTPALLSAVQAANGVAVLAHPARRAAWQVFDPAWSRFLLGVEVWNRKTDGWAPSGAARDLIRTGDLMPFVGMDFHDWNQMFPLAMTLDVLGKPTEDSVLACLRAGACQALAFGFPVQGLQSGCCYSALSAAEWGRRRAAALYRSLRKRA